MTFSIAIIHHPSRAHLIPKLVEQLKEYAIYTDHGWGLVENSKQAWKNYDKDKDFHLVLDDDSILCKDFLNRTEKVLKDKSVIYSLHWGQREIPMPDVKDGLFPAYAVFYGNALAIPTNRIDDMFEHCKDIACNAFDERIASWIRFNRILVMTPIPCLVEHNHLEKSLVGHNASNRKSRCFIDNRGEDGNLYD